MDWTKTLDPSKLALVGAAASFALSLFSVPPYNLAIFLFGSYAVDNNGSAHSLQLFTSLVGLSAIFDVFWMMKHEQNGLIKFLSVVLALLKIPTFLAFGSALRERGGMQFGGLGLGTNDTNGATVWSMPGGYGGGRDGYQTVDEESGRQAPPSSGPPPPPGNASVPPGAYQSV